MSSLSAMPHAEKMEFTQLRALLQTTQGNLGAHLATLEEAGFIAIEKDYIGKKPRTRISMTAAAFHVEMSGRTVGTLSLSLTTTADSVVNAAIASGFDRTADGAVYAITTIGIRFAANNVKVSGQYKLSKTYEVRLDDDQRGDISPSPMVTTADTLAMFGASLAVAPPEFTSR